MSSKNEGIFSTIFLVSICVVVLATVFKTSLNKVVVEKGIPADIPTYKLVREDLVVNVIFDSGILKSKSEVRRMIKQGAVRIDSVLVKDISQIIKPKKDCILKIGKRRFLKII